MMINIKSFTCEKEKFTKKLGYCQLEKFEFGKTSNISFVLTIVKKPIEVVVSWNPVRENSEKL